MFQTEYPFTLPLGYLDKDGDLHREGTMRLATAADEIAPLGDPRVHANEAYHLIILLSRVVTHLGSLDYVNPKVIEGLFSADLTYLQDTFNRINGNAAPMQPASCPHCGKDVSLAGAGVGGLSATPWTHSARR